MSPLKSLYGALPRSMGLLFVSMLAGLAPQGSQAQDATVFEIKFDGAVVKAAKVDVTEHKKEKKSKEIKPTDPIPVGTMLSVPARTEITLLTGSNKATFYAGARFTINQSGSKGESYSLSIGKALFDIVKVVGVHNVQHKDFNAHVKGTRYAMEVVPGQAVRYQVEKGAVRVEHEVKVLIGEAGKGIGGVRASDKLQAGQAREYRIDAAEYFNKFNTFKDAEAFFRRQLAADQASGDEERIEEGLYNLGTILTGIGKPKEALLVLNEGLRSAKAADDDEAQFDFLLAIGTAYAALSQPEKALEWHNKAQGVLSDEIDPDLESEDAADVMIAMGGDLFDLGEYQNALTNFRDAADVIERLAGGQPDAQLAGLYVKMGTVLRKLGNRAEMTSAFTAASEMLRKLDLKPNDPLVAEVLVQFGEARSEMGDQAGALRDFNGALRIFQVLYPGQPHPQTAMALRQIGATQGAAGDLRSALDTLRRALAMNLQLFPNGMHAEVAACHSELARLSLAAGDPQQSFENHRLAQIVLSRLYPDGVHPSIARHYWDVAWYWRTQGNAQKSAEFTGRYKAVAAQLSRREAEDLARLEEEPVR